MVGTAETPAAVGRPAWHAVVVQAIELRAPIGDEAEAIARVVDAQEIEWWGEPDGDVDDLLDELERVEMATGSLASGARVAVVGGEVVGVGLLVGYGQTSVSVDPASPLAGAAQLALFEWLIEHGGEDFEAPSQDAERLGRLASLGFTPTRSSFELERSADVSDLPTPAWPAGIAPAAFRSDDDTDLHGLLYSFWTDVPGHTYRPFDEWRRCFLTGSWFDADLVVVARADDGRGPLVGCALGRTFNGRVGWVSQLGVARSARGVGLGRAILLDACHRLSHTTAEVIGLGVEAENANALGLYRSAGMEITREWVHCARR